MIRSGVNGNAAIDGRGKRNRKRLRSTDLSYVCGRYNCIFWWMVSNFGFQIVS